MRPEPRARQRLLVGLALRDLWHDRKVSLCIVAALMAVVAPLLLLFGLKYGVVSQLRDQLLNDPQNLEVRMLGNHDLDPAWFRQLADRPQTAFAIPLTRSLNTQADLRRNSRHFLTGVEVIPSAAGDPLLDGRMPPQALTRVLLSARAAEALEVEVGDSLRLQVLRRLDGVAENGQLQVEVSGILDARAFGRAAVLVSLELLVALEDFRDGFAVPELGLDSGQVRPVERSRYARARIYARDLDAVAPLADWLAAQQIETRTRGREIESVKAISAVLGVIFAVIAWTAVLGCMASLAGAFLANIDRKRKDLAVLRLLGFRRGAAAFYVMVQALLLALLGFGLGALGYLVGSRVFNAVLGVHLGSEGFVCRLEPLHLLLALAATALLALLVAAVGGLRAIHIQPAESLREL